MRVYVERRMFLFTTISGFVVLLVALLLRLWWDLVEVYVVRNAMDGEGRVHHALLPAFRLLFRHFFRIFGSFLLAGIAGVCGSRFVPLSLEASARAPGLGRCSPGTARALSLARQPFLATRAGGCAGHGCRSPHRRRRRIGC